MRTRLITSSILLLSLSLPLSSCCTHVSCFKRSAAWIWPIERSEIITAQEEAARNEAEEQMIALAEQAPEETRINADIVEINEMPPQETQKDENRAAQNEPLNITKEQEVAAISPVPPVEAPAMAQPAMEETVIEITMVEPQAGPASPVNPGAMNADDFRAMAALQTASLKAEAPQPKAAPPVLETSAPAARSETLEILDAPKTPGPPQKLAMQSAAVPSALEPPAPQLAPKEAAKGLPVLQLCKELETLDYDTDENISFKAMIAGQNGWLFRTRSDLKQDFEFNDKSLESFKRLNRALNYNGTTVTIMMIPTRGLVGGQYLLPPHNMAYNQKLAKESYASMLERMRKSGMTVADMSNVDTVSGYFLTRDNHWTAEGARYSAYRTAQAVKALPVYKNLRKTEFQTVSSPPDKDNVEANDRFMDFIERVCGTPMPREIVPEIYATSPKEGIVTEAALFDDSAAPEVVLLGTSNSTQPGPSYANFAGFLKEYISADIDNEAISGGAFHGSIANYVLSGDYARNKPKLIIWELSGHYGFAQKETFREVIPALYGECANKDAIATYTADAGDEDMILLFDKLADKHLSSKDYYLFLTLHDTEMRTIKILMTTANGKQKQVKFKRSLKNFPQHNGVFFTDLDMEDDLQAQSINLKVDGRIYGEVRAKICKIP